MLRSLLLLALVPALAAAEPASSTKWLATGAHDAALRGDCETAQSLSARVAKLDPVYHRDVVALDPAITQCVAPPPPPSIVAKDAAQNEEITSENRIAAQILAGSALAVGIGAVLGIALLRDCSDECETPLLIGASAGIGLGSVLGVTLAGRDGKTDYSLGATVLGAAAGSAVGIGIMSRGRDAGTVGIIALIMLPPIGATIGFNLSKSPKHRPVTETNRPLAVLPPPVISDHHNMVSLGQMSF